MKRMKTISFLCLVLLLSSCKVEKYFDGPDTYRDGFESYTESEDLLGEDKWSFFQITNDNNSIELDSSRAHSGNLSLRFSAQKSTDELLSKCSVVKQKMSFWQGETVYASFWYWIEGDAAANWLFLFDIEEQAHIGAGPGMRLANVGTDNHIWVEHKYLVPNDLQQETPIPLPRNQWVHLEFEALLSKKKEGYVRAWQDGQLIISQNDWKTLPTDILYSQMGTKGMYSSIEFGITANTYDSDMVLYLDDVEVGLR